MKGSQAGGLGGNAVKLPLADPGGPGGGGPLASKTFLLFMQFSCNCKRKPPILNKFWAQGPPGVKIPLGPPDQNPGS